VFLTPVGQKVDSWYDKSRLRRGLQSQRSYNNGESCWVARTRVTGPTTTEACVSRPLSRRTVLASTSLRITASAAPHAWADRAQGSAVRAVTTRRKDGRPLPCTAFEAIAAIRRRRDGGEDESVNYALQAAV